MSVTIAAHGPAQSSWLQRLTGTEPRTIVTETSRTEITSVPGGSFNLRTALRNGGIGAAIAGALGGVSLLGRVVLPIIGKVATVSGLAKLAGVGGALGIATAALPLVAPRLRESPAARSAVTGAAIGAAAGLVLPLMPITLGAAIGAGVGLLVHNRRTQGPHGYPSYLGYDAHPGYRPIGIGDGPVPNGLVPVTPNYGMYGPTAMHPHAMGAPGYPVPGSVPYAAGYGMHPGYAAYGQSMTLPAQAQGAAAPAPAAVAVPSAAPAQPPRQARTGAKTFTDGRGNLRQVGTGTIIRPGRGAQSPAAVGTGIGSVPAGMGAPVGMTGYGPTPHAPASMMPGTGAFAGSAPGAAGVQPGALPPRPVA